MAVVASQNVLDPQRGVLDPQRGVLDPQRSVLGLGCVAQRGVAGPCGPFFTLNLGLQWGSNGGNGKNILIVSLFVFLRFLMIFYGILVV